MGVSFARRPEGGRKMSTRSLQLDLGARFPVIGVNGQVLGLVSQCHLDLVSQRVEVLLLETEWQIVELPCERVKFIEARGEFRVQRSSRAEP
jgi:hypothetical protein